MTILESTSVKLKEIPTSVQLVRTSLELETYIQVFNALPQIRNNSIKRQVGISTGDITFRSHSKFRIMTWINF